MEGSTPMWHGPNIRHQPLAGSLNRLVLSVQHGQWTVLPDAGYYAKINDESPKKGLQESSSNIEIGGEMSLKIHFFSRAGIRGPARKMGQWDIPQNFLGSHGMSLLKRVSHKGGLSMTAEFPLTLAQKAEMSDGEIWLTYSRNGVVCCHYDPTGVLSHLEEENRGHGTSSEVQSAKFRCKNGKNSIFRPI
ncbi:hypothetical protein B0H19DRAFT_1085167 [Mycena capillaripes]|nr:hypothetical protein B0H19DRAFT_1085167 [Mycena capillaripes]